MSLQTTYRVLEALAIVEHERPGQLRKRLKVSSTTLYRHANALIKAQCVHRYGNGRLSITDEGRERLAWLAQFIWVT